MELPNSVVEKVKRVVEIANPCLYISETSYDITLLYLRTNPHVTTRLLPVERASSTDWWFSYMIQLSIDILGPLWCLVLPFMVTFLLY